MLLLTIFTKLNPLTFVYNFVGELLVEFELADIRETLREKRRMDLHSAFQLS